MYRLRVACLMYRLRVACLVYRLRVACLMYRLRVACLVYRLRVACLMYRLRVACLMYRLRVACLMYTQMLTLSHVSVYTLCVLVTEIINSENRYRREIMSDFYILGSPKWRNLNL